MSEQLRISGKNLGRLALSDPCQRCFWYQLKLGFSTPFSIFPGIFSSIDSYTKKIVEGHFDRNGYFPSWLCGLGDLTGYKKAPSASSFQYLDSATNILLTGAPDGVYTHPDGTLMIVDYKTARYTDGQDKMLPEYTVQLNAYAKISEMSGFGTVTALKLIYFEPKTEVAHASDPAVYHDDGFLMGFASRIVDIPLNVAMLPPLLSRARALEDLVAAPERRVKCKDCDGVEKILELGIR